MKKPGPSNFGIPSPMLRGGFTLVEVVLVLVVVIIISGIALPYFSHAYKGSMLRTAARTIERMARYSRSMAIMRDEPLTLTLNHKTMEIYLEATPVAPTNAADGELDQAVLKRLGYVEGGESSGQSGTGREIHRFLPEGLEVADFRKDWAEDEEEREDRYSIHYYPDGQSDWFVLELVDQRGMGVRMENDPISGKIRSEFTQ